ncbi:hypothetical protein HB779_02075 [Phyllobacterium sp. 628]|uniref:hypothetical protein n=1 Tax=Phyllobacterium sp. 628 TaxID=2718938 RepID=UPI0016626A0B|nr:hypothetical protein [Phyllobacterium sp. 628]QND50809.1 hypothetical protein HB779_02075 [Phyllobacterium sp. 628]
MTMRLIPPSNGLHNPITVNGRRYSCAANSTVDVPDFDGLIMIANGWVSTASNGSGTTAQRPLSPPIGTQFHDTTLNKLIIFDGKTWRDPVSGAAI